MSTSPPACLYLDYVKSNALYSEGRRYIEKVQQNLINLERDFWIVDSFHNKIERDSVVIRHVSAMMEILLRRTGKPIELPFEMFFHLSKCYCTGVEWPFWKATPVVMVTCRWNPPKRILFYRLIFIRRRLKNLFLSNRCDLYSNFHASSTDIPNNKRVPRKLFYNPILSKFFFWWATLPNAVMSGEEYVTRNRYEQTRWEQSGP